MSALVEDRAPYAEEIRAAQRDLAPRFERIRDPATGFAWLTPHRQARLTRLQTKDAADCLPHERPAA